MKFFYDGASHLLKLLWSILLLLPFSCSFSPPVIVPSYNVIPTKKSIKPWMLASSTPIKMAPSLSNNIRKRNQLFSTTSTTSGSNTNEPFDIFVDMPPNKSGILANMKILPVLSVPSTLVIVRYKVPFGLDVAPKKGYAVCTKDGIGGEKMNDVLRFTSQWTLGLPRDVDGITSSAATIAGGLSWQCSMFDVCKAKAWEQVVLALTSNVADKTDEVVLIFERSLNGIPPELQ